MPPARVDPDRLRSLGAALGPLREGARDGADEALAQFPEVGDRETQVVLDGWVDQLADLLREVDATAADIAGRLHVAALGGHGDPAGRTETADLEARASGASHAAGAGAALVDRGRS